MDAKGDKVIKKWDDNAVSFKKFPNSSLKVIIMTLALKVFQTVKSHP
jgi:hypothetical protein